MNTRQITINPGKLTTDDSQALANYLNQSNLTVLKKDVEYGYSPTIKLTHDLVRRPRSRDSSEFVFDVLGNPVDKGGQGTIIDVIGTLHYQHLDHCELSTKVSRLAKSEFTTKDEILHEYKVSKTAGLNVKPPVEISDNTSSSSASFFGFSRQYLMTMDKIKGKSLDKIAISELSTDQRLDIAVGILRAAKRRVHARDIIHCDLKEANIIVYINNNFVKPTIIDFGGSKLANELSPKAVTPLYCPPEYFAKNEFNVAGDVFSLGCILATLFGADDHPIRKKLNKIKQDPRKVKEIDKHPGKFNQKIQDGIVKEANNRHFKKLYHDMPDFKAEKDPVLKFLDQFKSLFTKIKDLDTRHGIWLSELLQGMVSKKAKDRISLSQAISRIEWIIKERKIAHTSEPLSITAGHAHDAGVIVRDKLEALASREINSDIIQHVISDITSYFYLITDNPATISAFTSRLQTECLSDLKSLDAIQSRLTSLYSDFTYQLNVFEQLTSDIRDLNDRSKAFTQESDEVKSARKVLLQINNQKDFFKRKYMREFSIDNVKLANDKMQRFNDKLQALVNRASKLFDQHKGLPVAPAVVDQNYFWKAWGFFKSSIESYVYSGAQQGNVAKNVYKS